MLANQLMSDVVPSLTPNDFCNTALSWMEVFRISHLPVVENKKYHGLVSDSSIYDANIFESPVEKLKNQYENISIHPQQHFFEIINIFHKHRLTVLPVVNEKKYFQGLITLPTLIENFSELLASDSPGGIIILEMHSNDYSLSEIAQIIESNNAKVLACYISNIPESLRMRVTIKINKTDLTSILRTFERYEYEINATYSENDKMEDIYQDSFDSFMKYLNF